MKRSKIVCGWGAYDTPPDTLVGWGGGLPPSHSPPSTPLDFAAFDASLLDAFSVLSPHLRHLDLRLIWTAHFVNTGSTPVQRSKLAVSAYEESIE